MSNRIVLLATAVTVAAGLAVSAATASPKKHQAKTSTHLLVGINDEAFSLYGDPTTAFETLKSLKAQVIRVNLYWGGTKWAVAKSRPADPNDPGDPAYDWAIYDRFVRYATQNNVKVLFSILFTPGWANGGKARTVAPTNFKDLENFAYAAAERYSGLWTPPAWQQDPTNPTTKLPLPKVNLWTAWNEPNSPVWLTPQYKRVGNTWRVESAFQYAKICNAIYNGVHSQYLGPLPDEHVACGVTGPKGNDAPATARLLNLVSQYYGPKHLWITEYGYQTNPPDKKFGVSFATQAKYLSQSFAIARKNPRIDMMLWFLVRDEPAVGNWQSGLMTVTGKRKPAWNAFLSVPRG